MAKAEERYAKAVRSLGGSPAIRWCPAARTTASRPIGRLRERQRREGEGTITRRDGEIAQMIAGNRTVSSCPCCAPLRMSAEVDEEDIPGPSLAKR